MIERRRIAGSRPWLPADQRVYGSGSGGPVLTRGNKGGFMASFELLDRAANGFQTRLRLVTDAQRTLPTPCPELNVHDLVTHQIRGMRIYTLLLHGATREVVAKEQ
jgi:hypothetical protein